MRAARSGAAPAAKAGGGEEPDDAPAATCFGKVNSDETYDQPRFGGAFFAVLPSTKLHRSILHRGRIPTVPPMTTFDFTALRYVDVA